MLDEKLAPRDLVQAVLISLIHPRPILISTKSNSQYVERQTETVVEALLGSFKRSLGVVPCHEDVTWPLLTDRLAACQSSALILRNVERLPQSVQLHLGYAMMQPDRTLEKFITNSALILTTRAPIETLHPYLRRQILLKIDLGSGDDLFMVEVPAQLPSEKTNLEKALSQIRAAIGQIMVVPELVRYIHDIVIFVRTHRLARMGLKPQAATDFETLTRTLCVLQGRKFATPTVIKQAARLSLPVHVRLISPEDEPSLQYGGDLDTAREWIKVWDGDVLIDSVLEQVQVPK